jgi:hypothetical protein
MILQRISDLKGDLIKACERLGWEVEDSRHLLFCKRGEEICTIDARELAGPVSKRHLRIWLNELPPSGQAILITMGFFTRSAYKLVVDDQGARGRVTLVSLGLKDYMDTEFKPRVFQLTKPTDLYQELEKALVSRRINLLPVKCDVCDGKAVILCAVCDKLLCKRHMIPCILCKTLVCHPDTASACLFQHECER